LSPNLFTLISVDSHARLSNTLYHIDQHIDRHLSQSLMVSEAIALAGTDQDGQQYGGKVLAKDRSADATASELIGDELRR
jgi:hypothetical protein